MLSDETINIIICTSSVLVNIIDKIFMASKDKMSEIVSDYDNNKSLFYTTITSSFGRLLSTQCDKFDLKLLFASTLFLNGFLNLLAILYAYGFFSAPVCFFILIRAIIGFNGGLLTGMSTGIIGLTKNVHRSASLYTGIASVTAFLAMIYIHMRLNLLFLTISFFMCSIFAAIFAYKNISLKSLETLSLKSIFNSFKNKKLIIFSFINAFILGTAIFFMTKTRIFVKSPDFLNFTFGWSKISIHLLETLCFIAPFVFNVFSCILPKKVAISLYIYFSGIFLIFLPQISIFQKIIGGALLFGTFGNFTPIALKKSIEDVDDSKKFAASSAFLFVRTILTSFIFNFMNEFFI